MRRSSKPLLAITLGDPCGIGPEVVLRSLADPRAARWARYVLIGTDATLTEVARRLKIRNVSWRVTKSQDLRDEPEHPVPLVSIGGACRRLALAAKPLPAGGKSSVLWVERAVDLALSGCVDGIVTAPINKEAVLKGGYPWPGHTELLAARTGVKKPVMMMVAGGLRAAQVTTHVPIRELPKRITRTNVLATLRITDADLRRRFGIPQPRLAVCGLNPHAGEEGRFGREEERAIEPAMEQAREHGVDCHGPFPADAIFVKENRKGYDAIVTMYHDQACIPVKMLGFFNGVNVTLGLPIIRTSPDHGTAYDIAQKGIADPGSMLAAIRLAARMAKAARRTA